jgi:hypothetical protein
MNKVDSEREKEEDTLYLCVLRGDGRATRASDERQRAVKRRERQVVRSFWGRGWKEGKRGDCQKRGKERRLSATLSVSLSLSLSLFLSLSLSPSLSLSIYVCQCLTWIE